MKFRFLKNKSMRRKFKPYNFLDRDAYYITMICGVKEDKRIWIKKPEERCEFIYEPSAGVANFKADDFWTVDLRENK